MPNFLTIEFDPKDLTRAFLALDRLDSIVTTQQSELPYRCAVDFKNLVINNILTQKYSAQYAPYSGRYAHWKTVTMLRGSHFWSLYGDLLKNITAFRFDNGWMGGVPAGAMDSGGKSWFGTRQNRVGSRKSIAMYGRTMEYGLNNHPARPVFQPSTAEFISGGYSVRALESLRKIVVGWR